MLAYFGLELRESPFSAWAPMLVVEFYLAYFRILFLSVSKTRGNRELISKAKCFVLSILLLKISLLDEVICPIGQFGEFITAIAQQNYSCKYCEQKADKSSICVSAIGQHPTEGHPVNV